MDDTISTYLSPSFSFGKRKKQTSLFGEQVSVGWVHVMAVLKMLTADWVADVEVLEMRFRANISPRSVYDQFHGPVKIRMLLLKGAVCNVEYSIVL